ncbi:MAG: multicopper oxidase domain-containing protein [Polyangiaceae bacterium]
MRNSIALLLVAGCASSGCTEESVAEAPRDPAEPYPATGVTREIDLTIEDVEWGVGPGAIYKAIAYNGQVPGPLIDVDAGDHVVVHLTNHAQEAHSVHTHVVRFTNENDGTDPVLVEPGETHTYEWDAVYAGTFPYHDHGDEVDGIGRGLFGMLVVHAPDEEPANEHYVVLADFSQADYKSLPGIADPVTGEFPKEGTYRGGHEYMHTINGKGYEDAVPPFTGKVGELERWRVISLGPEFHTWHIHGHRWTTPDGTLTDNIELGPGMYTTFEFEEDNPGDWLVHCHVSNHMEGGMVATYSVSP